MLTTSTEWTDVDKLSALDDGEIRTLALSSLEHPPLDFREQLS